MKYEKDIAAHVIANIALIESTRSVVVDVQNTIFNKLNAVVKKCIEDSDLALGNDNEFELNCDGDGELYFSTMNWEASYKKQIAYYFLCFGVEDDEADYYGLTHLLGESSETTGLRLQFVMEKDELGLDLRKFKSTLKDVFLKTDELSKLGFQLSEDNTSIELKLHLDKNKVAEEYPDLDESFEPVIKALNTLFEAHPHFEILVDKIKSIVDEENTK